MKKFISLLSVLILLMSMSGGLAVSAAASADISVNNAVVTIGDQVTVTATFDGNGKGIGSLDARFQYNVNTFEYVGCTGATANGSAGSVKISYYSADVVASSTVTIILTFKALSPGEGEFKWTTEGMYDDEDNLLGNPSKELTVIASNPTKSGNADLKSLVPSKGTLSPKFSPDVTEYKISVNHSVTSLTLSATPDHSEAKTSISGKNALEVGKNTRVITVTAPNGTTKKYTVVITRAAAPSTTSGTASNTSTGTTTTIPTPPEDALEVEVNGKVMTILDTQATADLPEGFTWSNLAVNMVEVPAAINRETGMILLYLTGTNQADNDFYIYDVATDSFSRYRRMNVENNVYMLYDLPEDQSAPAGVVKGNLAYTNHFVTAYVYEDAALSDFYIVWAAPLGGEAGWYTYDKKEETLQRYHATPSSDVGVIAPTAGKHPAPTKTTAKADQKKEETKDGGFSLTALLGEPRQVLLIGGFALVGVAIVTAIILLILSAKKRKNRKYRKGKH